MSKTDTPAKVASNDRLGPLPEYAHEFSPRWFGDDGGFTGAQMRRYALAAVAAERERCAAAVRATPTHKWVGGSDQWGQPCPAKVVTTREQYAQACERA